MSVLEQCAINVPGCGKLLNLISSLLTELFQDKQATNLGPQQPRRPVGWPEDLYTDLITKTEPGTSGTQRRPKGNVPVAYVSGTAFWGSVGMMETADSRAMKLTQNRRLDVERCIRTGHSTEPSRVLYTDMGTVRCAMSFINYAKAQVPLLVRPMKF